MNTSDAIVYVVDDDPAVRRALKRLIRSHGLTPQEFPSADEFLAHPLPENPACLILDVRMPGLSGLDLQERLASAGISIPIVFITGHGDIRTSVRAMKKGAADFLEKPFEDQELLDIVDRAIQRDRISKRNRQLESSVRERYESLTDRERDVLALVVTGLLNKQVAAELGISEKTVKVHRARVMEKMQAESLAELVRLADYLAVRRGDSSLR